VGRKPSLFLIITASSHISTAAARRRSSFVAQQYVMSTLIIRHDFSDEYCLSFIVDFFFTSRPNLSPAQKSEVASPSSIWLPNVHQSANLYSDYFASV
jgi:hypothetical protein